MQTYVFKPTEDEVVRLQASFAFMCIWTISHWCKTRAELNMSQHLVFQKIWLLPCYRPFWIPHTYMPIDRPLMTSPPQLVCLLQIFLSLPRKLEVWSWTVFAVKLLQKSHLPYVVSLVTLRCNKLFRAIFAQTLCHFKDNPGCCQSANTAKPVQLHTVHQQK